jgi:hypothetical protein
VAFSIQFSATFVDQMLSAPATRGPAQNAIMMNAVSVLPESNVLVAIFWKEKVLGCRIGCLA